MEHLWFGADETRFPCNLIWIRVLNIGASFALLGLPKLCFFMFIMVTSYLSPCAANFANCTSLPVDTPMSFGLSIRAQHFSQPHNFTQLVRMRGFKRQCSMNIAKPWMELKIQNKYWNTTRASAIARNPNTHVTPEMGRVDLTVHGGLNKMEIVQTTISNAGFKRYLAAISQTTLSNHLLERKCLHFDWNFTEACS